MSEKILLVKWVKIILQGYEIAILQGKKKPNHQTIKQNKTQQQ